MLLVCKPCYQEHGRSRASGRQAPAAALADRRRAQVQASQQHGGSSADGEGSDQTAPARAGAREEGKAVETDREAAAVEAQEFSGGGEATRKRRRVVLGDASDVSEGSEEGDPLDELEH